MLTHKIYKKVVLLVLDGFGVAPPGYGNAISQAKPKTIDYIVNNYPHMTLQASGALVGLPWGEMGNSETGHLNIGAGRTVMQDMPRITKEIQAGAFFKNQSLLDMCTYVRQNNSSLHVMGMVSAGGVHSLDQHCYALVALAKEQGIDKVFIHMFTDGRDTGERVALSDIEKLEGKMRDIGAGQIATIMGRFYAMDRGGHYDQTMKAYQTIVDGVGEMATSAKQALEFNYAKQIFDEMIPPTVIMKPAASGQGQEPVAKILPGDAVIFFNFRSDRAIQLTRAFVAPDTLPPEYKHPVIDRLYFATMTEYHKDFNVSLVYPPVDIKMPLGEVVSSEGLKQFHIAESEKYAHVTSFINGTQIDPYPGEDRQIIQSPSNKNNYVDTPAMSAEQITDVLLVKLKEDYNLYVVNFANADMVGHTGNLQSTITAIGTVDAMIERIMTAVLQVDGCLVITADHGNAEIMITPETGAINKDHTTSPVPLLIIANDLKFPQAGIDGYDGLAHLVPSGVISDIAPTILDLLGLPPSLEMTGVNLSQFL